MSEQQQMLTVQQALDLAIQHHTGGRLAQAESIYQQILQNNPNQPVALHLLGVIAHQMGKNNLAIDLITRALHLKPDQADAHNNLGISLQELGKLEESAASYQKALTLKLDYAEAHNNLGTALRELGKLDEAVASCQKAIDLKPDYHEAHNNVGNALKDLGKLEEAVASYRKALKIEPDYVQAHSNLGHALQELGPDRFAEAKETFDQGFHISHGGAWWNAETFTDDDSTGNMTVSKPMHTSTFQLIDTIDQLEYLITKDRIDHSFQRLADRYRVILAEIQLAEEPAAVTKLSPDQLERLGSSYNRVIHYAEAPRINTCAINESHDFKQIEDRYLSSPVSVTTLDDFLMPEALHALREFCLESTIFFTHAENHYVSSKLSNGFTCDLLYQVAKELKECFPKVLGNHHLANTWIYRYNDQGKGVAAHTDDGAVTFNFWITPDDANQIPDRGGLIVYTKEQPYDWDWRRYNRQKYTPAISREIADFLTDADTVTIPYRQNRAALFHSNLFHKSDEIHFKDGFENRRMSITLLFGKRKS